ncbi:erythromycin esterase family protein [Flavobacterium aquaticum]|uniref:erythromycin esterase family protein n=1 Tax=Flavobacterium aquaticum TaxID=1236486 RepID=UPI0015EBBB72|nr:erythromycin esterase family protein [Flavobacterium aquaticum]
MIALETRNELPSDFKKLDKFIENKEIILLGEAAHGEGKTFEAKTQIVKYLVEVKGFNTIALEGMDFLEMEFINGRHILKDNLVDDFETEWYNYWNPWHPAKQLIPFENFIKKEKLSFVGIEPYNRINTMINIDFIKTELAKSKWANLNNEKWSELAPIFDKINNSQKNKLTIEEFEYFTSHLQKIIDQKETILFHDDFFLQMLENLIIHVNIKMNPKIFDNEDDQLAYEVNQRDLQMARNLIHFKERNPNAKIIVWLANFHGAINIKEVAFAASDSNIYKKLTLFGEHIKNKYSDKVYSIATTSSEGFSKMPYNIESIKETKIISPETSLEFELSKKNINFGFIDLNDFKQKNPKKANTVFNSIMLGHVNQEGKWLNVFDGLLYIKKNDIAIPKD